MKISTFDAQSLSDLQACPRKFLLASEHKVAKWNPKRLFDACFRNAIIQVSNGGDLEKVRADARAQFLQSAANPGLDVAGNPYMLAKEWCCLLDVLITYLQYLNLPQGLREGPEIPLGPVKWKITAQTDQDAGLHRFITTDKWNALDAEREVHSWWIAGDSAVLQRSITLHIFDIGQMRRGERASLWVRGYRHPKIPNMRVWFRLKDGKSFQGWDPVRLLDNPRIDVEDWARRIWEDGAGKEMTHTLEVEPPSPERRMDVLKDILLEASRASKLDSWEGETMHRGACDGHSPCQFKPVCYEGANLYNSGLYIQVSSAKSIPAIVPLGVVASTKVM